METSRTLSKPRPETLSFRLNSENPNCETETGRSKETLNPRTTPWELRGWRQGTAQTHTTCPGHSFGPEGFVFKRFWGLGPRAARMLFGLGLRGPWHSEATRNTIEMSWRRIPPLLSDSGTTTTAQNEFQQATLFVEPCTGFLYIIPVRLNVYAFD